LRMYGSKGKIRKRLFDAYAANAEYVRFSKILAYEKPYCVKGTIKHTGS